MMRIAVLSVLALALAAPVAANDGRSRCAVAGSADADLKGQAASFFPKADATDLDALAACLADPDPAVRDGFAYALWTEGLRGRRLNAGQMRHSLNRLTAMVEAPGDPVGFRQSFAALVLAEIARTDRVALWMTDAELRTLARTGAAYLRGVDDYRGFAPGEGWRHGVAHGADLALQLALNPRLSRDDAELLLGAIAVQVAPAASPYYRHGEPGRLARPVLFLAKRDDIDDAAWAAWFAALHPDGGARWENAYSGEAGLAALHNSTAFAQAVYANAAESPNPQIRRLAPLAIAMLKALP